MESGELSKSIASSERILKLIEEADNELNKIKPEIEYLEQCQVRLNELKQLQYKLISMKTSLKSLLKINDVNINITKDIYDVTNKQNVNDVNFNDINYNVNKDMSRKIFLPDQAISNVKNYIRVKNNLNFEIFKAVVFNSGVATTEDIKNYLVENNIKQPKTGKGFESVALKEISSRVNYLVRKNVLLAQEPGVFRSVFGWKEV